MHHKLSTQAPHLPHSFSVLRGSPRTTMMIASEPEPEPEPDLGLRLLELVLVARTLLNPLFSHHTPESLSPKPVKP